MKVFETIGRNLIAASPKPTDPNKELLDNLTPRPGESFDKLKGNQSPTNQTPELDAFNNLPDVDTNAIFTTVIKSILTLSMILTIIAIVIVAYYYITAQGDDEYTGKAKKIILYLLIGLGIMAGSYGIILGLSQFNFFT